MKVLIAGAGGQVGCELHQLACAQGLDVTAFAHKSLDITDAVSVQQVIGAARPDVVINAAAYTAVDRAETEPERAFLVNKDGAANLARAAHHAGALFLHLSTDYVFDGSNPNPYTENDTVCPINVYGASKAAGDEIVRQICPRHVILRVSWVFGRSDSSFPSKIRALARQREELRVVSDQRGCPTYAGDIAAALLQIAQFESSQVKAWGTYHYAGAPVTNWHEFATAIVAIAAKKESLAVKRIMAITSAEFPMAARRPVNSVLDTSLCRETWGLSPPSWEGRLPAIVA